MIYIARAFYVYHVILYFYKNINNLNNKGFHFVFKFFPKVMQVTVILSSNAVFHCLLWSIKLILSCLQACILFFFNQQCYQQQEGWLVHHNDFFFSVFFQSFCSAGKLVFSNYIDQQKQFKLLILSVWLGIFDDAISW